MYKRISFGKYRASLLLLAFTRKPRRGASSLAEAATKPKSGMNSVVGFISKYARLIGLHQKAVGFKDLPPLI
jgi:hypothetical protein